MKACSEVAQGVDIIERSHVVVQPLACRLSALEWLMNVGSFDIDSEGTKGWPNGYRSWELAWESTLAYVSVRL